MAGLGLIHLLQYVPLDWLAKLPPGATEAADCDSIECVDAWPTVSDDGPIDGHGYGGGHGGMDGGGGHGGHGGE